MTTSWKALRSCVAALLLLTGPAHAVSINDAASTESASRAEDRVNWQQKSSMKCDQASRRLDKARPGTGAYAQFELQKNKYCGVAAVPTPAVVPVFDPIVESPLIPQVGSTPGRMDYVVPTAVPEPGSLALLGFGLAGLSLSRRRKAD